MVGGRQLATWKRAPRFLALGLILWLLIGPSGGCHGGTISCGGNGCGPGGPPSQFGSLFISIFDPMIAGNVQCIDQSTGTDCVPPPVFFAGHTSATGSFERCFVAEEFGSSVPTGFPPAGFPPCAGNRSVVVAVSWQFSGTSSGWLISATPGNLQPGSWSIAWQTPLLNNNKPMTCSVTIFANTAGSLSSCP